MFFHLTHFLISNYHFPPYHISHYYYSHYSDLLCAKFLYHLFPVLQFFGLFLMSLFHCPFGIFSPFYASISSSFSFSSLPSLQILSLSLLSLCSFPHFHFVPSLFLFLYFLSLFRLAISYTIILQFYLSFIPVAPFHIIFSFFSVQAFEYKYQKRIYGILNWMADIKFNSQHFKRL